MMEYWIFGIILFGLLLEPIAAILLLIYLIHWNHKNKEVEEE